MLTIAVSGSLHSSAIIHNGAVGETKFAVLDMQNRSLGMITLPPTFGVTPGKNSTHRRAPNPRLEPATDDRRRIEQKSTHMRLR